LLSQDQSLQLKAAGGEFMKSYAIAWATGLLGLLLFSQSCAVSMVKPVESEMAKPAPSMSLSMTGSSQVYEYGKGQTVFSTKGLEELYPEGAIDFINSPDPMVRHLLEKIPFNTKFYILIINGSSTKKTLLQINDSFESTSDYGRRSEGFALGKIKAMPIYTFAPGATTAIRLEQLKLHVQPTGLASADFTASSALRCVIRNTPGPKGEYRNGALTLQIVDATMTTFDEITRGAGRAARLLAEFTLHKEDPDARCR
jgi:hypothetical protein